MALHILTSTARPAVSAPRPQVVHIPSEADADLLQTLLFSHHFKALPFSLRREPSATIAFLQLADAILASARELFRANEGWFPTLEVAQQGALIVINICIEDKSIVRSILEYLRVGDAEGASYELLATEWALEPRSKVTAAVLGVMLVSGQFPGKTLAGNSAHH
jgi:hypothetical protein